MIRRQTLATALAALLAAAPAWAEDPAPAASADASSDMASTAPAITVTPVTTAQLRDRIIASGLVTAVETVQVAPLVEGQPIDELLVDVGDRVEEGQVLARLSPATLDLQLAQLAASRAAAEAAVAQAEAALRQAQTNADEAARVAARNVQLAESGTLPQAQADQTTAAAQSAADAVRLAEQGIASARAQAELVAAQTENADLQRSRTEVRAPVAGLVTARNAQVGAIASAAAAPMFTIIRDGAMELRAEVSEIDLLRIAPGQRATLTAAEGQAPLHGTVRLVEPEIDARTRLGAARIEIDAADAARVVAGMFLTAEILVEETETLAVPVSAIGALGTEVTVMRVDGDVVRRVEVQTGLRDRGLVAVTSGLTEGDLIVTKAGSFLRDGSAIRPVVENRD